MAVRGKRLNELGSGDSLRITTMREEAVDDLPSKVWNDPCYSGQALVVLRGQLCGDRVGRERAFPRAAMSR